MITGITHSSQVLYQVAAAKATRNDVVLCHHYFVTIFIYSVEIEMPSLYLIVCLLGLLAPTLLQGEINTSQPAEGTG